MRRLQKGLVAAIAVVMLAAACSEPPQSQSETASAPETAPAPVEPASEESVAESPAMDAMPEPAPDEMAEIAPGAGSEIEPGAGIPMADGPMAPTSSGTLGSSTAEVVEAPAAIEAPAPAPVPAPAPAPAPVVVPPAAANGHATAAKTTASPARIGSKVLSYFQQSRTQIDTRRAFGFVLMPKVAVTDEERRVQKDFCTLVLASMDFMTPGAVAAAPREVMATYWPIVASRASFEIADAFANRNCDELLAWYDHKLARSLATKAGVAELTGPLLITWPSSGADGDEARDPLIVDFSKANHERATKALQYWFRQLKARPDLWTNRIREGTIRAELADAVNDTAGVVLAVLSGKWDSVNVVMGSN